MAKKSKIKIKVDDYIICKFKGRKKSALVTYVAGEEVTANLCDSLHHQTKEPVSITVDKADVYVNLGPTPPPGRVYNTNISPLYSSKHTAFGDMLVFDPQVTKDHVKKLVSTLGEAHAVLEDLGLIGTFPLRVEIKPLAGKMVGSLKSTNRTDTLDVLTLYLEEGIKDDEINPITIPTIYHEVGHSLMAHLFTPSQHLEWIHCFNECVTPRIATAKEVKKSLKDVIDVGSIYSAKRTLEDELSEVIKVAAKEAQRVSFLSEKELDKMLHNGEDISEYWPTGEIKLSTIQSPLGEYSQKNYSEFFSEAIRIKLTGHKVPKSITKLLNKTLKELNGKAIQVEPED